METNFSQKVNTVEQFVGFLITFGFGSFHVQDSLLFTLLDIGFSKSFFARFGKSGEKFYSASSCAGCCHLLLERG